MPLIRALPQMVSAARCRPIAVIISAAVGALLAPLPATAGTAMARASSNTSRTVKSISWLSSSLQYAASFCKMQPPPRSSAGRVTPLYKTPSSEVMRAPGARRCPVTARSSVEDPAPGGASTSVLCPGRNDAWMLSSTTRSLFLPGRSSAIGASATPARNWGTVRSSAWSSCATTVRLTRTCGT